MTAPLPNNTRVTAPLGIATIVGHDKEHEYYAVCYSRRDFTPEVWATISRYNGDVVYRMYEASELEACK